MSTDQKIGLRCDGVWTTAYFGTSRTGGFGLSWPQCDTEDDTFAVLIGTDEADVVAQAVALGWWIEPVADPAKQRAQCPACRAAGPAPEWLRGAL